MEPGGSHDLMHGISASYHLLRKPVSQGAGMHEKDEKPLRHNNYRAGIAAHNTATHFTSAQSPLGLA